MDCSVLHMDSRQQMEQLDFRKRRMMMADTVCRLLEWVRMDNCRAILRAEIGELLQLVERLNNEVNQLRIKPTAENK